MILNPVAEKFILHWGEMGSKWGVNRTVAQIHALLYFVGKPMPADEITETLGVARSNVSNSLKELQNWNLIQVVHIMGDRRDHFTTSSDVWVLFKTVVKERKEREFDPTIVVLRECLESQDLDKESKEAQDRISNALKFMEEISDWGDQMLKLDKACLTRMMRLGGKIRDLLNMLK
jgi:DNA-binding transcriptional regulator GbsR (MarR family)